MSDAFNKKQNDFPHDTEEEKVLLKSVAEAWVIEEQTEIELTSLREPDPTYSEEFWNAMNTVAAKLNKQQGENKSESAPIDMMSADKYVEDNNQQSNSKETERTSITRVISLRRFLVAAVVVCLIAGVPLIAAASGIKFFQLFQSKNESSMDIGYRADDAAAVKGIYYLSKLPDGYRLVDQDINDTFALTVYGNPSDSTLPTITLYQYDVAPNIVSLDQENLDETTVEIAGVTGKCYYSQEKCVVFWEMDDKYFQIVSKLQQKEAVELANSIRK